MFMTFWGVRALTPVPGKDYVVYGGNTICVSVEDEKGNILILDAGTGIVKLGNQILSNRKKLVDNTINLFITGSYYDHIQGFPFFIPAYMPNHTINCYSSALSEKTIDEVLENQMHPLFSPIQSLKNLKSKLTFKSIDTNEKIRIGDMKVEFININSNTCGVSIKSEDKHLVYLPDIATSSRSFSDDFFGFIHNADYLICDSLSEISVTDYNRDTDGRLALDIALKSEIKNLILFHYYYTHTDKTLNTMKTALLNQIQDSKSPVSITLASEGASIIM